MHKSVSCSGFYPGFSETEEIRMMRVDDVRESGRMKWLKNKPDVEDANSKISRTMI